MTFSCDGNPLWYLQRNPEPSFTYEAPSFTQTVPSLTQEKTSFATGTSDSFSERAADDSDGQQDSPENAFIPPTGISYEKEFKDRYGLPDAPTSDVFGGQSDDLAIFEEFFDVSAFYDELDDTNRPGGLVLSSATKNQEQINVRSTIESQNKSAGEQTSLNQFINNNRDRGGSRVEARLSLAACPKNNDGIGVAATYETPSPPATPTATNHNGAAASFEAPLSLAPHLENNHDIGAAPNFEALLPSAAPSGFKHDTTAAAVYSTENKGERRTKTMLPSRSTAHRTLPTLLPKRELSTGRPAISTDGIHDSANQTDADSNKSRKMPQLSTTQAKRKKEARKWGTCTRCIPKGRACNLWETKTKCSQCVKEENQLWNRGKTFKPCVSRMEHPSRRVTTAGGSITEAPRLEE